MSGKGIVGVDKDSYIRKLSEVLRPNLIVNEKESINYDQGAMQYLESIKIEMDEKEKIPCRIIVKPKMHLSSPPLIQALDAEFVLFSVERGKGFEWIYELSYESYCEAFNEKRQFRIEIIK